MNPLPRNIGHTADHRGTSGLARSFRRFAAAVVVSLGLPSLGGTEAHAADDESPGLEALDSFREPGEARDAVRNRFFLKQGRFEVAPFFGYVPNNAFARRLVAGGNLAYHFTETLAAQGQVGFSPDGDEGDVKQLTSVLLDRAYNGNSNVQQFTPGGAPVERKPFQQPFDKVQLAATFGISWAPIYGKINLVGETVLNFDLYGSLGAGIISKRNYVATYDEAATEEMRAAGDIMNLQILENEVKVAPSIGIGGNFFLNQFIALKLDARSAFYVDNKPQYDPDIPVAEQRLYNNFVMSAGLGFFFPKMKPRLYVY